MRPGVDLTAALLALLDTWERPPGAATLAARPAPGPTAAGTEASVPTRNCDRAPASSAVILARDFTRVRYSSVNWPR